LDNADANEENVAEAENVALTEFNRSYGNPGEPASITYELEWAIGNYPLEGYWEIRNSSQQIIAGSMHRDLSTTMLAEPGSVTERIRLPPLDTTETYTLMAYDSFGDGWGNNQGDPYSLKITRRSSRQDVEIFNMDQTTGQMNDGGSSLLLYGNFSQLAAMTEAMIFVKDTLIGCTDPASLNYNYTAIIDDGSCEFDD